MTAEEQAEELERERTQTPVLSPSTAPFRAMTPEAGEMPELHDYRQLCESIFLDPSIPMVPTTSLRVAPSRYWCYRGGEVVDAVGDALSATVDIAAGQAITVFRGTTVTMEEARTMQEESQGRYLIQISDDEVLDAMADTGGSPVVVSEDHLHRAYDMVRNVGSFNSCATGISGFAGVLAMREEISDDERIVVIVSGVSRL